MVKGRTPDRCQQGTPRRKRKGQSQNSVTTQRQFKGAFRTKQHKRNHIYSGLLIALQWTYNGQMARKYHWSKRTGEANMPNTKKLLGNCRLPQPRTLLWEEVPEESTSATIYHCRQRLLTVACQSGIAKKTLVTLSNTSKNLLILLENS